MKYIIICGPSSVGKTTYASKYFKDYKIIDSDNIWFELAKEYKYDRKKIDNELFKRMYKTAIENKKVVLIHTDPNPLLKYFNRNEVKILLLASNFKKLSRNLKIRNDRSVANVLGDNHTGFLFYFSKNNNLKTNSLFLKKKDLDNFPLKTKEDKKAVNNIITTLFDNNRKTTRVSPKINIDYDNFIIL